MEDGIAVKLEGIAEARQKMASLEKKIVRRVVTKAVRAGGVILLKAARAAAPTRSGSLRKALKQSVKMDRSSGTVRGSIKVDRKKSYQTKWGKAVPGNYMHLVTLGTQPHEIRPETKRAMTVGDAVVGGIHHPGARPNDFLGGVARQSGRASIHAFTQRYGTEVEIEATKT